MESQVSLAVLGVDASFDSSVTSPTSSTSFADLGLPDGLVAVLDRQGITTPLPIQAATIADALAGRDVSAKAPTGSGKTLAFALPIAATVPSAASRRPTALVLAPTRELATQIAETFRPLLATRRLRVHTFFGGAGFGGQRNALKKGVDVAVACPGRLEDLLSQGEISLSAVEVVVVDEADRLADMGFLPAVKRLLDATSSRRQTLLFSATLDGAVDVLVRRYQSDPVRHEVMNDDEDLSRMTHHFESVAHVDRLESCTNIVSGEGTSIVFVRTKHGVDRLAKQLSRAGVAAAAIHGGRSQSDREKSLAAFRAGRVRVLVATDVAARGIHVDGVTRVVHFDLPADAKDYIHRSGRTARAGAEGSVISLVLPDQKQQASSLRRDLRLDGASGSSNASSESSRSRRAPSDASVERSTLKPAPRSSQKRDFQRPKRHQAPVARPADGRRDGRGGARSGTRGGTQSGTRDATRSATRGATRSSGRPAR